MKAKLFQFFLVSVLLAACAGGSWEEFTSTEGAFSVLMPKKPSRETQTVDTSLGPIEIQFFSAELADTVYMVAYSDYPAAFVAQSNPVVILDGARDGAVANVKGKLVSEHVIFIGGNTGRELRIEIPDAKMTAVSRIFLVNNRLYQVMALMPAERFSSDEITTYLDSFALTATN